MAERVGVDIDDRDAVGLDVCVAADAGVELSMHLIGKECGIAQARPAPSHIHLDYACKCACEIDTTWNAQARENY